MTPNAITPKPEFIRDCPPAVNTLFSTAENPPQNKSPPNPNAIRPATMLTVFGIIHSIPDSDITKIHMPIFDSEKSARNVLLTLQNPQTGSVKTTVDISGVKNRLVGI